VVPPTAVVPPAAVVPPESVVVAVRPPALVAPPVLVPMLVFPPVLAALLVALPPVPPLVIEPPELWVPSPLLLEQAEARSVADRQKTVHRAILLCIKIPFAIHKGNKLGKTGHPMRRTERPGSLHAS
jgi:hypothetical protein